MVVIIKAGRTGWIRAHSPTGVPPQRGVCGPPTQEAKEEGRFSKPSLGGGEECCSMPATTVDVVVFDVKLLANQAV